MVKLNKFETEESKFDTFPNPDLVKHFISKAKIVSDKKSSKERFLIKFLGTPMHIQEEEYFIWGRMKMVLDLSSSRMREGIQIH